MLHNMAAQILFLCNRDHRYIQFPVSFMTTRVKSTDEDDWGNLKHYMKYLKQTRGMNITLQADSLNMIKWYADESFETHHDCRG